MCTPEPLAEFSSSGVPLGGKMTNVCIFQKPDSVCYHYDKRLHRDKTVSNSEYGWDDNGYCVVDIMGEGAIHECCMYEAAEKE